MEKSADAFRTISEVAEDLRLPQHVLRFWETRFPQIRPLKRAGGRRYYRPADTALLRTIRQLLYDEGYTIKGVQRLLKEQGVKRLSSEGLSFGPEHTLAEHPDDGDDACGPERLGGDDSMDAARTVPGGHDLPPSHDVSGGNGDRRSSRADAPSVAPESVDDATLRHTLAVVEDCLAILRAVR